MFWERWYPIYISNGRYECFGIVGTRLTLVMAGMNVLGTLVPDVLSLKSSLVLSCTGNGCNTNTHNPCKLELCGRQQG